MVAKQLLGKVQTVTLDAFTKWGPSPQGWTRRDTQEFDTAGLLLRESTKVEYGSINVVEYVRSEGGLLLERRFKSDDRLLTVLRSEYDVTGHCLVTREVRPDGEVVERERFSYDHGRLIGRRRFLGEARASQPRRRRMLQVEDSETVINVPGAVETVTVYETATAPRQIRYIDAEGEVLTEILMTYHAGALVEEQCFHGPSTASDIVSSVKLQYNNLGQCVAKQRVAAWSAAEDVTYEYDDAGNLHFERRTLSDGRLQTTSHAYQCDTQGNWVRHSVTGPEGVLLEETRMIVYWPAA